MIVKVEKGRGTIGEGRMLQNKVADGDVRRETSIFRPSIKVPLKERYTGGVGTEKMIVPKRGGRKERSSKRLALVDIVHPGNEQAELWGKTGKIHYPRNQFGDTLERKGGREGRKGADARSGQGGRNLAYIRT